VIKQINTTRMSRKERAEVENEVAVLSRLRCPNIVAYVDSFHYRGSLCIVMEYADGGDLEKTLKGRRGKLLPEPQVLDWFIQICLALKYVHNRKILHRDLKPANIMLGTAGSGPPVVKLGDFGIAKVLSNTMELARTAIGTPYYLSPEICREERYNNKSDIWSLGCILYEMCSLKHAFEGRNMKGLVRAIMRGKVAALPRGFSPGVTELISACLHRDARRRPRVDRILQHPLLQARIEAHLGDAARAELAHTVIHGLRPMRDLPVTRPDAPQLAPPPAARPVSAAPAPAARVAAPSSRPVVGLRRPVPVAAAPSRPRVAAPSVDPRRGYVAAPGARYGAGDRGRIVAERARALREQQKRAEEKLRAAAEARRRAVERLRREDKARRARAEERAKEAVLRRQDEAERRKSKERKLARARAEAEAEDRRRRRARAARAQAAKEEAEARVRSARAQEEERELEERRARRRRAEAAHSKREAEARKEEEAEARRRRRRRAEAAEAERAAERRRERAAEAAEAPRGSGRAAQRRGSARSSDSEGRSRAGRADSRPSMIRARLAGNTAAARRARVVGAARARLPEWERQARAAAERGAAKKPSSASGARPPLARGDSGRSDGTRASDPRPASGGYARRGPPRRDDDGGSSSRGTSPGSRSSNRRGGGAAADAGRRGGSGAKRGFVPHSAAGSRKPPVPRFSKHGQPARAGHAARAPAAAAPTRVPKQAAAAAAAAPKPKADRGDLRAHIRRLRAQQARERAHRRASGEPAEDGPPVEVLARPMLELAAEAPGRGKDVPRGRRYDEPSPSAVVPSSLASDAPPAPPGGAGSPRRVSTSPLVSPRRHVLAPPPVGVGFVPAPRHGGGAHPQRRPIPAPAPSAAGPSPASAAAARAEDALMASIREVEAMRPRVHSPPRSGGGGGVPLIDARTEWVGGAVPRRGVQEGGAARRLDLGGHDDDDDPGIALSGDDDHSGGSDEDEDDDGDEDAEEAVAVREAEQTLRALRGEADRAALMQSMVAVSHTAGAGLDEEAARAREEQAELEDGEWLDSDEEAGEGKDDDDDDDDGLEAEEEEEEGDGGAPGAGGAAHGGATSHELAYVREVLERQVGARRLAEACSSLAELDLAEGFEAARLALGRDNEHLLPLVQRLVVTGSTVRRR